MTTILFLCQHGGAKSVIAASYFNQLGLPFRGVAAAAGDPYEQVPAPVVELLARDGVDVRGFKPRQAAQADLDGAVRVVTIDCVLPGVPGSQPGTGNGPRARRSREHDRWDDVPPASEDLEGAAAAIRRHVGALAAELRERH